MFTFGFFSYFLSGKIAEILSVNISSGEIRTIDSDAFDYERQSEVFFQAYVRDELQTRDEPLHTVYTQIRVDVIDVNDTPPQLILVSWNLIYFFKSFKLNFQPQGALKVMENDDTWEATIEATDPDTTADLEFFIDWDGSSVSGSDENPIYYRK